jgi:hypothetical protein
MYVRNCKLQASACMGVDCAGACWPSYHALDGQHMDQCTVDGGACGLKDAKLDRGPHDLRIHDAIPDHFDESMHANQCADDGLCDLIR